MFAIIFVLIAGVASLLLVRPALALFVAKNGSGPLVDADYDGNDVKHFTGWKPHS